MWQTTALCGNADSGLGETRVRVEQWSGPWGVGHEVSCREAMLGRGRLSLPHGRV